MLKSYAWPDLCLEPARLKTGGAGPARPARLQRDLSSELKHNLRKLLLEDARCVTYHFVGKSK